MHRALKIPEIREMVCEAVAIEGVRIVERDLARLAQTCRFFFDPAVNVLWRKLGTISHLLRCMPDDLWDITELNGSNSYLSVALRRTMTSEDWERPLLYMHRVRLLFFTGSLATPGFLDAISWSLPGDCIFPNLEELDWHPNYPRASGPAFHYLRLFLTPRLTSLSLGGVTDFEDFGIFQNLALKCPSLKTFWLTHPPEIVPQSPWDRATSIISNFVCRLTHIESLNVPELNDVALAHLAQLPHLKRLTIESGRSKSFNFPLCGASIPFPALTQLAMATMDQATSMITALGRCALVKFTLEDPGDQPTTSISRQFYSTLATHCSHSSLQTLRTGIPHILNPAVTADEIPVYAVGRDILEPLFSFSNLVDVFLSHPVGFDLDDATVVDMARSWPQIEYLGLEAGPSGHVHPRVTLEGLSAFAQHCPYLQRLFLTFDATVVPETKLDATPWASQQTLQTLDVAVSPILDPDLVAEFLSGIFPRLTNIGTLYTDIVEDAEEFDLAEVSVTPAIVAADNVWQKVRESLGLVRDRTGE